MSPLAIEGDLGSMSQYPLQDHDDKYNQISGLSPSVANKRELDKLIVKVCIYLNIP